MIIIILMIIMIVYTYIDFCTARIFDTHLGTMSKCCLALMRKQKIRIFPKHAIRSGSFRTSNCIVYMRGNFTFELAPGVLSRSEQICAGTGAICEQPTTSQVNYCCVVSIAKPQQIFRSYSSKLTTAFRFAFVCVNKGCVATLACVASPHVPCLCIFAQAFSCEPYPRSDAFLWSPRGGHGCWSLAGISDSARL